MFRKMSILSKACAAGALSLALGAASANVAFAQNAPPARTGGNPAGRIDRAASAGQTLTSESLPEFLENLGYTVTTEQDADGDPTCQIAFDEGGYKGVVGVSLSPDKTKLWLVVSLTKLSPGGVTSQAFQQLLERNDTLGATKFAISSGTLIMKRPVDNRAITPARFRNDFARLMKDISENASLWETLRPAPAKTGNPARGNTGGRTPAARPAPGRFDPQDDTGAGDVGPDGRFDDNGR